MEAPADVGVLEAGAGSDGCLLNRSYRSAPVARYTNMENETPIQPTEVQLAASQLGKRGRGRPKTITPEDRQRRVDQMETINEKRRTVRVQGIVVNGSGGATPVITQAVTGGQRVVRVQGRAVS